MNGNWPSMWLKKWLADAEQPYATKCVFAAGGDLNEMRFGEQHSSNVALAILAVRTGLYERRPLSSCQVRQ